MKRPTVNKRCTDRCSHSAVSVCALWVALQCAVVRQLIVSTLLHRRRRRRRRDGHHALRRP